MCISNAVNLFSLELNHFPAYCYQLLIKRVQIVFLVLESNDVMAKKTRIFIMFDLLKVLARQGIKHACVLQLLFISVSSVAQSVNVDSRLLNGEFTNLSNLVFTPDGRNVLFLGQAPGSNSTQLYRQSVRGGAPQVLNPNLVAGGNVSEFKLTPDGQQIIYKADQLVDNKTELFRVPVIGGAAIALDPNFPSNRDVSDFNISPDGQTVVYFVFSSSALFSIDLVTGNLANLTADLPSDFIPIVFNDQDFQIDANSEQAVFKTRSPGFRRNGLFRVGLNGESLTRITALISENTSIEDVFFITSDGLHVVYAIADAFTGRAIQLLRVLIDGSELPVALTEQVSLSNDFRDLLLTPDDAYILTVSELMSDNQTSEILKIPVFLNQPIERLSQPFNSGVSGANHPIVSADGRFVVYAADPEIRFQENLFQVPIEGGTPLQLSQLSPNSSDGVLGFTAMITPDSQQVVYVEGSSDADNDFLQLFASPIQGGERLVLSERLIDPDEDDLVFSISSNSQQLIYRSLDFKSFFLTSLNANTQGGFCFVIPAQQRRFATICL